MKQLGRDLLLNNKGKDKGHPIKGKKKKKGQINPNFTRASSNRILFIYFIMLLYFIITSFYFCFIFLPTKT